MTTKYNFVFHLKMQTLYGVIFLLLIAVVAFAAYEFLPRSTPSGTDRASGPIDPSSMGAQQPIIISPTGAVGEKPPEPEPVFGWGGEIHAVDGGAQEIMDDIGLGPNLRPVEGKGKDKPGKIPLDKPGKMPLRGARNGGRGSPQVGIGDADYDEPDDYYSYDDHTAMDHIPMDPPANDFDECSVPVWGDWTICSANCGGGTQTRWESREHCPRISELRDCNTQACETPLIPTYNPDPDYETNVAVADHFAQQPTGQTTSDGRGICHVNDCNLETHYWAGAIGCAGPVCTYDECCEPKPTGEPLYQSSAPACGPMGC